MNNDNDIYIIEETSATDAHPMGMATRFVSIFVSPGRLMENLAMFPKLGAASLFIMLLSVVSVILGLRLAPIITNAQSVAIAERYGVDFLNLSSVTDQIVEQQGLLIAGAGWISEVAGVFLGAVLSTLGILILTKIMRGGATFKQLFALCLHVAVFSAVGSIVSAMLMLAMGSHMDFTSLAPILMPNGNFTMLAYNLLSAIGIFGIWSTVITAIGIKKMNDGFSTAKAVTAGIIIYIASIAVHTAITQSSVLAYDMMYKAMQVQ